MFVFMLIGNFEISLLFFGSVQQKELQLKSPLIKFLSTALEHNKALSIDLFVSRANSKGFWQTFDCFDVIWLKRDIYHLTDIKK